MHWWHKCMWHTVNRNSVQKTKKEKKIKRRGVDGIEILIIVHTNPCMCIYVCACVCVLDIHKRASSINGSTFYIFGGDHVERAAYYFAFYNVNWVSKFNIFVANNSWSVENLLWMPFHRDISILFLFFSVRYFFPCGCYLLDFYSQRNVDHIELNGK